MKSILHYSNNKSRYLLSIRWWLWVVGWSAPDPTPSSACSAAQPTPASTGRPRDWTINPTSTPTTNQETVFFQSRTSNFHILPSGLLQGIRRLIRANFHGFWILVSMKMSFMRFHVFFSGHVTSHALPSYLNPGLPWQSFTRQSHQRSPARCLSGIVTKFRNFPHNRQNTLLWNKKNQVTYRRTHPFDLARILLT